MKALGFLYAVVAYLIGFVSLLYWIASTGSLLPFSSIDGVPELEIFPALIKNIGLVLLFGVPHSIMARAWFKRWITKFIPQSVERSTYVWVSGILLAILVYEWEPLGGQIWSVPAGTLAYNALYGLYFLGWAILFISTFLINHFDLFGLRQAYFDMVGKPYTKLKFRVVSLYKVSRHPLYLGGIIGIWATPKMTVTHLLFAILLTSYFLTGIYFEEKDMIKEFGDKYLNYKAKTSKLIPFKLSKSTPEKEEVLI